MTDIADAYSRPEWPAEGSTTRGGVLSLWLGPAIFVGLFICFFSAVLWFYRHEAYRAQMREIVSHAEAMSEGARLRLTGTREYLMLLAKERGEGLMDAKSFQDRASSYVAAHPELINIAWVDSNYFITDVAPLAPNKQIVGLRLDLPEPKRASHLAMETRQPVYTRPFEVIQGGLAFELWVPVFANDAFVGLFGGVYSYEGVLRALTSPRLLEASNVGLVDDSGKVLLELPGASVVDHDLIYDVPLMPPENAVNLRLSGHKKVGLAWGLLALEAVCLSLVFGMAYAMAALKIENVRRRRAEREVLNQQQHLEDTVTARTADLASANAELEGFAYSVSHDLRAPLRAVDGFSQILVEDYGSKLDDEGLRVINIIREGAQKMGRLIDDILAFSRVGRLEMKHEPIDMDGLVRSVLKDLEPVTAGRKLTVEVKPLPPTTGDVAMIQRVWMNLLDNAVKFTRPKNDSRIEVGATVEGQEITYYVKDDGVGFDMKYVAKLFGIFQRLIGPEEFPGTGIGLAIVKRIVGRHGGRVWAEGKLGEGATFYFTLKKAGEQ